jgi:hypothetical protein
LVTAGVRAWCGAGCWAGGMAWHHHHRRHP